MIHTIEFTLPNHWACPLINGDETGLDEAELDSFYEFCFNELENLHCVDVKDDSTFVKYHDAMQYALAGDCSTFTFMKLNEDYDN
jgi:hypothetical protein